jgi:GcrA cell cycle regulator
VFKAPRPARPAAGTVPTARRAAAVVEEPVVIAAAPAPQPAPVAAPPVVAPSAPAIVAAAVEAPEENRSLARFEERGSATVLTLGARMCKWPIGDPSSDEFTFCGRRSSDDGPYCVEHARVAYQPQQSKKKSSSNELARSLRRYV